MLVFREIEAGDIPSLFEVRTRTRENRYSLAELERLGITPESVERMMASTHRGWLCEEEGSVVGFAMGDGSTGEMWVIAVLPSHERRGVGSRLLRLVEGWLASEGWREAWLTTDEDAGLRAYGFYRSKGWRDLETRDGLRYMVKALNVR